MIMFARYWIILIKPARYNGLSNASTKRYELYMIPKAKIHNKITLKKLPQPLLCDSYAFVINVMFG